MSEIQSSIVPWSELAREGHLPRLLVLCFGIWLYAADSTLVATLMPAAVEEIGPEDAAIILDKIREHGRER